MNATLTASKLQDIATELKSIFGDKPAMDIIDLARNEKLLVGYGVKNVKDVFLLAQALNNKVA